MNEFVVEEEETKGKREEADDWPQPSFHLYREAIAKVTGLYWVFLN